MNTDAQYPIGRFDVSQIVVEGQLRDAVTVLAETPELLRNAVEGLESSQLGTPYREGGWTIRQVVHHMADSHMNAFIRLRLALTEEWPAIKLYNEKAWADLHDATAPIEWSLELVESLHARWVMLVNSLTGEQWKRGFVHPVNGRMTLEIATMQYAWHSRHHIAHITHLRAKEGW